MLILLSLCFVSVASLMPQGEIFYMDARPEKDEKKSFETIRVLSSCNTSCVKTCSSRKGIENCDECLPECYRKINDGIADFGPFTFHAGHFKIVPGPNHLYLRSDIEEMPKSALPVLEYRLHKKGSVKPTDWMVLKVTDAIVTEIRGYFPVTPSQFRLSVIHNGVLIGRQTSQWVDSIDTVAEEIKYDIAGAQKIWEETVGKYYKKQRKELLKNPMYIQYLKANNMPIPNEK